MVFKWLKNMTFILVALVLTFSSVFRSGEAQACCSCIATVAQTEVEEWLNIPDGTIFRVNEHTTSEFTAHRIWIVSILWEDNILPALMLMAEQLTAVAMQQAQIIGSFLDAKHQLETQQVFQKLSARAHKDYQPSIGMCEFGSNVKSLAASERKAELNTLVMSQRSQDRALGNTNTSAHDGGSSDKRSRVRQYREKFCDPSDNNNGLHYMCDHDQDGDPATGPTGAADLERMNKDIDFVRTVEFPWTLEVDFTDTNLTDNEEEILALAANLYGHTVFERATPTALTADPGSNVPTNMQKAYMDARSVIAKRSVAENSFHAITSMKSEGTPGARDFMAAVLGELGVPGTPGAGGVPSDIDQLLGTNPSYYAQMEVLTKKIFQNPDFYTNLYDKPVNVNRKGVALQAIGLMQKFDLFKSYLRTEANMSVLLELAVMELQEEMENEINVSPGEGDAAEQ